VVLLETENTTKHRNWHTKFTLENFQACRMFSEVDVAMGKKISLIVENQISYAWK